jgi:hypothetical protein
VLEKSRFAEGKSLDFASFSLEFPSCSFENASSDLENGSSNMQSTTVKAQPPSGDDVRRQLVFEPGEFVAQ